MGSSNEAPGIVHASAISTTTPTQVQDPVVQYVVLRKDLWQELKWPLGSVAAQACHAATAVMWMNRNDEVTCQYLSDENLDHMHKVRLGSAAACCSGQELCKVLSSTRWAQTLFT